MDESPIGSGPGSDVSGANPSPIAAATPVPLEPATPAVSYGGFWVRTAAAVIDFGVLLLLWFATDAVIRFSAGAPAPSIWKDTSGSSIGLNCAENLVHLAVWWLYAALSESSPSSATLGKRALRLRVTDTLGRRISFARATARTAGKLLSCFTLFIGFAMAGFTRRKQALHDVIAETVVLRMN